MARAPDHHAQRWRRGEQVRRGRRVRAEARGAGGARRRHSMTAAMRAVLTAELIERLRDAGLDPQEVTRIVSAALAEDLAGRTDVTTEATIPAGARSTAYLTARADGVVAGLPVAETVFRVASARSVPPAGSDTAAGD